MVVLKGSLFRSFLGSNAIRYISHVSENNKHPNKKYDVAIIGGGHNGLVAAAYLQKAGAKVCILERRHIVGGAAVTEEIVPGFKFSRASYVLSLMPSQIYLDLELKKHGLKVYKRDPSSYTPLCASRWNDEGARSLTLGCDLSCNAEAIGKFSRRDAEVYADYEKELQRLVAAVEPFMSLSPADMMEFLSMPSMKGKLVALFHSPALRKSIRSLSRVGRDLPVLYELFTSPASRILSRWFESEPLRATLATDSVIGTMASPDTPGTGYVLLHHIMGEVDGMQGAWGYPEGGMGSVTQAIAACAKSHGAHIFTDTPVTDIMLSSSGVVTGVVTSTGQEVRADVVLSNATAKVTYLDLLPSGTLPAEFESDVRNIDYSSPVTKINVAVSRLPDFLADPCDSKDRVMPHHRATIHLNCEESALITQAYDDALHGKISEKPMIEMVIPSSLDPTLAPPGAHVCLFFTQYTPYHLEGGREWDDTTKEQYANKIFHTVEEYAPGFMSSIVGSEVLSPPDLERVFGLTGGNIFHGAMTLDQLFLCRPTSGEPGSRSPLCPVPHLLLCGSGAHPGGGVMGTPGRIAALSAIRALAARGVQHD